MNSNKWLWIDDSEVDVDDTSVLLSKTVDSLTPTQREYYESNKSALTSASIGPSQTDTAASFISEAISIEGIEGHDKPLVLG